LKILLYILYIYIQQKNQQRWTIAQSKKNMSVRVEVETIQHLYLLVPHFPSSSAMNDSRKNAKTKTTKKL
jgi:hypothetical protein